MCYIAIAYLNLNITIEFTSRAFFVGNVDPRSTKCSDSYFHHSYSSISFTEEEQSFNFADHD